MTCRPRLDLVFAVALLFPCLGHAQDGLGPSVPAASSFVTVEVKLSRGANTASVIVDLHGRAAVTTIGMSRLTNYPTLQLSATRLADLEQAVRDARLGEAGADLPPFAPNGTYVSLTVISQDPALDGTRSGHDPEPLPATVEARLRALIVHAQALVGQAKWGAPEPFEGILLVARGAATQPVLEVHVHVDGTLTVSETDTTAAPPIAHAATRSLTLQEWRQLLLALKGADLHQLPATLPPGLAPSGATQVDLMVHGTQTSTPWRAQTAGPFPTQHPGAQALIAKVLELAESSRLPSATTGLVGSLQTP